MSAASIFNLVRALSRPYPGAHCLYQGQEVKIWRVEPSSKKLANIEPGKVLAADGSRVTVACGEGIVNILSHEFPDLPRVGSYL
ncbi:Bifunctional polymyxin resistance protein ArnA [compost metagenome]